MKVVRVSKLQMLATQFEESQMQEDGTIYIFSSKLRDIANKTFQLGEQYPTEKLVRKTLRSLPMRPLRKQRI